MLRRRHHIAWPVGFSLLLLAFILIRISFAQTPEGVHDDPPPQPLPHVRMMLAGEYFDLEVAVSQADLLRGLMYRNSVPAGHGMLFPFYPPRAVTFWMKNTRVPLDMIFIRDKSVVNIVNSAAPCLKDPCPNYNSVWPVDMVVELPGGTAAKYGITEGDALMILSTKGNAPATSPATTESTTSPPPADNGSQPVDVFPSGSAKPDNKSKTP